ncbi:MAG: thiosulfate sulfurtransferase [Caldithrix sp. RBG_13_44_9]|nr:MAG: thiosulfate sulfurtransferase [Caldithrix sp. RBG_13_44_9]
MENYKHPEVLVTTDWVAEHKNDPDVRIVESDEDILLYETGHIPNTIKIDWQNDLQDPLIRDYLPPEQFEKLLAGKGIASESKVVFYGDKNNWWACYAFWAFKLYGHKNCLIMDGGRQKWISEGRPLTKDVPHFPKTKYQVSQLNEKSIRAFREKVILHTRAKKALIDVRSPQEFSGELLHMENYPQEGALRGGHIPQAQNVPWAKAVKDDGTFRSYEELIEIYQVGAKLKAEEDIIAYCRIGERSAHTWFVLTYLLGYPKVKNYDGSWTEWGNMVRAPIER